MPSRDVRRRLEQYASNPGCEANVLSAVHDISMADVASALGLKPKFGQSPFAIRRGILFEKSLFESNASRLREALARAGVLPEDAGGFVDFRIRKNSGPQPDLETSRKALQDRLEAFAKATGLARLHVPSILAGCAMMVPGRAILPDGLFATDVVTVHPRPRPEKIVLRIGEIKVFSDRGGHTEASALAAARAQAGLYVHVLRTELIALKLTHVFEVADDGFLVLSQPGSNFPSVRAGEDLRYQAERAGEAFERLRGVAARAVPVGDGKSLSPKRLAVIENAAKQYGDACLSFCDRADRCRDEMLAAGRPVALGDDMARFLGEVSLHRALELLGGAKAENEIESDFVKRAS